MTTSTEITAKLAEVRSKLTSAIDAIEADAGSSPILIAVVREFDTKLGRAEAEASHRTGAVRERIVEAEQAGDSAKIGAEADTGLGNEARQAVLDAHLAICMLKAST